MNGAGQGVPTGITFNSSNDFQITANTPARFVLATEDGGIFAWAPGLAVAVQMFPPANGATTAVYKGIALAGNGTGHQLYAADLSTRRSTCAMPALGRSRRRAASSTPASLRPAVLIRRQQQSLISQRALADGPDRPSATASTRARLSRNKRWQASVRRGDGPLGLQTSDS